MSRYIIQRGRYCQYGADGRACWHGPGDSIELTDAEAAKLGDRVVLEAPPVPPAPPSYDDEE